MTIHTFFTTRLLCFALLILLLPMPLNAKDFWWPYLAAYDAGPGSTRVNLGLKKLVPFSDYPNLVVTGTTYATTRSDGLPDQANLDRLNVLSGKVIAAIQVASPSIYAGTFTHNREQLHYVYVKNITGIEKMLSDLYAKACTGCKIYTNIKRDPAWSAYRDFLYPNPATLDFHRDELKKIGFMDQ
jgi:hypothetical protein